MNEELSVHTADESKKDSPVSFFFDILEMFAWALFVVFIIFTFSVRLCRVDGSSMEDTLYADESLLVFSLGYTPKQDDIIVFHLTKPDVGLEKTLVKRVIATENSRVTINFKTGEILVDSVPYEDTHRVLKSHVGTDVNGNPVYLETNRYDLIFNQPGHSYDPSTGIMEFTVPENQVFVMGDNRNNSKDSRNPDVGFVDEACILGKVIVRLSPFTVFS